MEPYAPYGPWRLLWLACVAAALAWTLHLFSGPPVLQPRAPFSPAGALAAEVPRSEFSRARGASPLQPIERARAKPFLERTMIGLNGVADRINGLRRRAAEGLQPLDASAAVDLGAVFAAEVAALDRYAAEFEAEGLHSLDARAPVLLDLGDRGLLLQLTRWRSGELDLPEVDFRVRREVEALHEALNVAYYRLVAQYRELKRARGRF